MAKVRGLTLKHDLDGLTIEIDNGEGKEPTHVLFWHTDEVKEDPGVWTAIITAVRMYYEEPVELCSKFLNPDEFEVLNIIN